MLNQFHHDEGYEIRFRLARKQPWYFLLLGVKHHHMSVRRFSCHQLFAWVEDRYRRRRRRQNLDWRDLGEIGSIFTVRASRWARRLRNPLLRNKTNNYFFPAPFQNISTSTTICWSSLIIWLWIPLYLDTLCHGLCCNSVELAVMDYGDNDVVKENEYDDPFLYELISRLSV